MVLQICGMVVWKRAMDAMTLMDQSPGFPLGNRHTSFHPDIPRSHSKGLLHAKSVSFATHGKVGQPEQADLHPAALLISSVNSFKIHLWCRQTVDCYRMQAITEASVLWLFIGDFRCKAYACCLCRLWNWTASLCVASQELQRRISAWAIMLQLSSSIAKLLQWTAPAERQPQSYR